MNMNIAQSDLAYLVSRALLSDPRTSKALIDVNGRNGIVTLGGEVREQKTRDFAEEIARRQKGVVSVINEIKVE